MDSVDPFDIRERLSPNGQRLVVSTGLQAEAIDRAGLVPVEIPGEFVDWDSTGNYITYEVTSSAPGTSGIWWRNVTTGHDQLLVPGEIALVHGVSPDSQFVAYQTNQGLFAMNVDTGQINWIVGDSHDPVTGNWAIRFVTWLPVP